MAGTIPILYQSPDIIAADKPAGLATIPESDGGKESLRTTLEAQLGERLLVVHRLDKGVSGVVLFARNVGAHRLLNAQFDQRTVVKRYWALVHGRPAEDRFTVDLPLRVYGSGRVAVDLTNGKASSTLFVVLERYRQHALVEAQPASGRRHQIRVHLYGAGHPVAGDLLYGDRAMQSGFDRLLLHSLAVAFRDAAGERVHVEAPLPPSFTAAIQRLEGS